MESKETYIQGLELVDLLHPQKLEIRVNSPTQTKDLQILYCGALCNFNQKNP